MPLSTPTPVVARNNAHLELLVGKAIKDRGLDCDLNHIDVSGIDKFQGSFRHAQGFKGDISSWIPWMNCDRRALFEPLPMQAVVATDRPHLDRLLDEAIHTNGPQCDLNHIDVARIADMSFLFAKYPQFNGDISKWDVSNARSMDCMFQHGTFNGNISQWNVSKVTDMQGMFRTSKFNGDISRWNVSNVQSMREMFVGAAFNNDISKWTVSRVRDMTSMFNSSKFNGPLNDWNVSNVQSFAYMFANSPFDQELSDWKTAKAQAMQSMFSKSPFNRDISQWDVSSVKDIRNMFQGAAFAQDISNWAVRDDLEKQQLERLHCTFERQRETNTPFLKAQSMSPWIVRLHLANGIEPADPVWAKAFQETQPVATGLGLSFYEHSQAILAMHANIAHGQSPAIAAEQEDVMDSSLFG